MPPDDVRAEPRTDTARFWSSFAPTQLVAGRFEIVRFIGHGAMGAVYEAKDSELGDHVALKTIRPEIAADPQTRERFRHEIQLARRVTHPNVCRVFDLFHHQPHDSGSPSPAPDATFVTMELLKGETLSERLRRTGRFTTAEALPIVEQLAAGLAAAHKAAVLHCDFKSSNVMLAPGEASEVRAVVTDFGLARARPVNDADTRTASDGAGTPAYMAPEQVEGHPPTAASDQYALGIVMYEMVTGLLPFRADTPLGTAVRRLQHDPPPPRTFVPDLDASWQSTILRCLDRNPASRFESVSAVPLALKGESAPAIRSRRAIAAWALAAVATALVFGWIWRSRESQTTPRPATSAVAAVAAVPTVPARRPVAVIGFRNLSGRAESAWLSTAFAEMLTTELAAAQKLRTIPGEDVARMKVELGLSDSESYARDTLATLDALRALPPPARDDPRIDLEEAYAAGALSQFGRAREAAARAAAKSQALGARLLQARAHVEEGWELWHLGQPNDGIARTEAARQIFTDAGDRNGVAKAMGNIAYITHMQGEAQKARRLYEEVLAVHRQTGNQRGLAWTHNNLANLLADQGDIRGAKRMYGESLAVYRRTASDAGQAGTLGNIANLLQYEGDLAGSRRTHEASLTLYRKTGARMNVAIELTNIGTLLTHQGDLPGAHRHLEEALAIKRDLGNKSSTAFTLTGLGQLLLVKGDLAGARKAFEEALAIRSGLNQKARAAGSRLDLAQLLLEENRPREATDLARETIETFRNAAAVEDEAVAYALVALGELAQDRSSDAKAAIDRAVALLPRMETRSRALMVTIIAAQVKGKAGDRREPMRSLSTTLGEARRLGLVGVAFEARLALGEMELALGRRSAGRAGLAALTAEAEALGFTLIARKAVKARPLA